MTSVHPAGDRKTVPAVPALVCRRPRMPSPAHAVARACQATRRSGPPTATASHISHTSRAAGTPSRVAGGGILRRQGDAGADQRDRTLPPAATWPPADSQADLLGAGVWGPGLGVNNLQLRGPGDPGRAVADANSMLLLARACPGFREIVRRAVRPGLMAQPMDRARKLSTTCLYCVGSAR